MQIINAMPCFGSAGRNPDTVITFSVYELYRVICGQESTENHICDSMLYLTIVVNSYEIIV
jgi:hypothetical protein